MADFFETLFAPFTGGPAQNAAQQSGALLSGIYGGLTQRSEQYLDQGLGALQAGQDNVLSYAPQYFTGARNDLTGGTNQAEGIYNQNYLPNFQESSQMNADALGMNGPEGIERARSAFKAGPGYEFMMDQGVNALSRAAGAGGMAAGGNVLQEAQRYGSGLANQEYQNWLKGVAGREALYAPYPARLADTYMDEGKGLAGIDLAQEQYGERVYGGYGKDRANLMLGHLQAQAGLANTYGPAIASTMLSGAKAQQQAGQNIWDTAGNVANFFADFIPFHSGGSGGSASGAMDNDFF
jgi:hypothetical protein